MAEAFAFELKLVTEKVKEGSKKAVEAVKSVEKAGKQTTDTLGKQFEKIGFAAARAAKKQQDAFANSFAKIGMAAERAKQRHERLVERQKEKSKEHSMMAGFKEATGIGRLATASFLGDLAAEGVVKIAESMIEGAKAAVEIITDGVKDAFKAAGHEQVFRLGEKLSLGKEGGKEFREDVERFSDQTGFNPGEIRKAMLPLRRAGFSQNSSRQAFATATDIAAGQGRGGDMEAVTGILDQFQHLKTKGGIGKKQLVELLGGSGDTIPEFYKELGKKLKVSAKTAEKMAEEGGKIDPQLMMNMITASVNKKQGGIAGTGGAEYGRTFEATMHKLSGLQDRYFEKLVETPGFKHASDALSSLLEKLSPESPAGARIMESLDRAFEKMTGWLDYPDSAIEGMADGIENMIGLVEELLPDLKEMGQMLMASAETIADIVRGARLAVAVMGHDTEGANRIITEQSAAAVEKETRKVAKQNLKEDQGATRGAIAMSLLSGGLMGGTMTNKMGKVIHLNMHPGAVVVHAAPGEEPDHTHRRAGEKVKQHVQDALEQAAQEGGG